MIKSTAAILHFFFLQLDTETGEPLSPDLLRDMLCLFKKHNLIVAAEITLKDPEATVLKFKDKSELVLTPEPSTRCVKMAYNNPPTNNPR